jgi:hypothetical protein
MTIQRLRGLLNVGYSKYIRNFRYYWNSTTRTPQDLTNMVPLGWENYYDFDENYYPLSDINVVKSCIDTVASKIANQKVRPLMTPIN